MECDWLSSGHGSVWYFGYGSQRGCGHLDYLRRRPGFERKQSGSRGAGGWSGSGTVGFVDNLYNRGESGITNGSAVELGTQTDFAPWGGTITFDNDDVAWHYDHTTSVDAGKFDFYSAALHELVHAIGFGNSNSWDDLVSSGTFTGSQFNTSNGGSNVSLYSADGGTTYGHWLRVQPACVFPTGLHRRQPWILM